MGRTTSSLMQRLNQMRTLNKMLSGASGSAWCGLPHIQVDKPEHLLMWMEIRALCLASDRPQQLQREVNVAVTTALSTGMAMVSLFWVSSGSLQNHEKPGLLYFQSLLTVLSYVINLPHVLLAGILANLEHHQSINLLSQHMLQAQFALLHGPNTNFTDQERAKIRETLEVSKTLSQQLAMDSTQIVSVLMVLRLMLQFIKRGSDDRDAELEEVATETLRNLLGVLVSTNILGFMPKTEDSNKTPPVWWQMTWDCIEVFIPGFGEDFSKSLFSSSAAKEAWEHFIFVPLPQSRLSKTSLVPYVQHRRADESGATTTALQDAVVALGLAGAGAMGTMLAPSAAFLKLAMMVPPPPSLPPAAPPLSAAVATPQQFSLLDTLLPNFNTDTFIWRVSMLQITEYVGSLLLGSAYGSPKLCSLYLLGASWGPAIAQGAVWRLMLPMMLHANALHIFFNLFFQMRIGFGMEKQFGRRKFCLLYMFCGFLGNLISVAADPMKLAVGASTSGFGLLGVWAAEVLLTWDLLGESRSRIFLWFAFMCTSCIMMSTISPNVDFVGHFAGMLAGFLLAVILADMQEEHQPPWYNKAKFTAKNVTALIVIVSLVRAITLGPDGPIPYCGTIFHPRRLPF
eukprot:symbB.v1.2.019869.t3/scaffold1647.1/size107771/5